MMISIITIQSTQEDVCNGALRQFFLSECSEDKRTDFEDCEFFLSLILDEMRSFSLFENLNRRVNRTIDIEKAKLPKRERMRKQRQSPSFVLYITNHSADSRVYMTGMYRKNLSTSSIELFKTLSRHQELPSTKCRCF